jgi:signal transduction histidine kinase
MTSGNSDKPANRPLPEAITRVLRHEVGDLLQTVYAAVAILQKRLPADCTLERRVLTDMRARGETCKALLDTVHDFVCPVTLHSESVDLADVTASLVALFRARFPKLQIEGQCELTDPMEGDARRLGQVGEALLLNACEAAHHAVRMGTRMINDELEWTVSDDGPGVAADQLGQVFAPFYTTRHGHPGLGLAVAKKIAELHGGSIQAANRSGGGFEVRVLLPVKVSAAAPQQTQT